MNSPPSPLSSFPSFLTPDSLWPSSPTFPQLPPLLADDDFDVFPDVSHSSLSPSGPSPVWAASTAADADESAASTRRSVGSKASRRRAQREESLSRRAQHAASDARRRANLTQLQQALVRLVRARTGRSALNTQQALEEALLLLQQQQQSDASTPPSPSVDSPPTSSPAWSFSAPTPSDPSAADELRLLRMGTSQLLPAAAARSPVVRPLVFSNSHMRQLSTLMGWALCHYASGAAFHPCQPHFRSSPALHSILAGGGRCGVLSHDMRLLDCTHDISLTQPMSELLRRPASSDCRLHLSDSDNEPPLSYDDLAHMLHPAFRGMEEQFVQGATQASANCLLVAALQPRAGCMLRSLKLLSLARHADGREPVLIAVQFIGACSSSPIE